MNIHFPSSPVNTNKDILKPTKQFRFEATKVASSIVLFACVYLILVFLAICLAALVTFLGFKLIIFKAMFATLMVGIGLMGLGLMVIYFLVKFIFSTKKVDISGYYEIKKSEFPDLFEFVKKTALETKAPMPKRIFLAPNVNAAVFYNSSFLSMFLPVRKNLLIGLGLVNSVNISEFKAVLAHEFGHFSQHSMRLGSYVYNVNKIIYNMLYENEGYSNKIDSWASASGYFAIFALFTIKIVSAIQWVLQKIYIVVNKANLSLSRQMEHHADTVSSFVSGPNNMISALKRIEIGDNCYNLLINKYNEWIGENYKPDNLYDQHMEVISHFADEFGYKLEYGLPATDSLHSVRIQQSRINIKDQWATHPSNKEREEYLLKLSLAEAKPANDSPWILFETNRKIKNIITDKLFEGVKYEGEIKRLDLPVFKQKYFDDYSKISFNKEYKGFYDKRRITRFDTLSPDEIHANKIAGFHDIFTDKTVILPSKLDMLKSDIRFLNSLTGDKVQIKSFDFEGIKSTKNDIPALISRLEGEKNSLEKQIEELDPAIYSFFYYKADQESKKLLSQAYTDYFNESHDLEKATNYFNELINTINPIYYEKLPVATVHGIMDKVKEIEKAIKQHITELLPVVKENKLLNELQIKKMESYIPANNDYFDGARFNNNLLHEMHEVLNLYVYMLQNKEFELKKRILDLQLQIIDGRS